MTPPPPGPDDAERRRGEEVAMEQSLAEYKSVKDGEANLINLY